MKKTVFDGFSADIVAVSFDAEGNRIEQRFDLFSEEEKRAIRQKNHEAALKAAGYRKAVSGRE